MSAMNMDMAELSAAIELAADRVTKLIQSIPDTDVPTRGLEWTVGETAAHLVVGNRAYTQWANRSDTPKLTIAELPAENRRLIEQVSERDTGALADAFAEGARTFLEVTAGRSGDELVPWFEHTLSLHTLTSVQLAHILMHGYDIARTVSQPLPIEPSQATLVLAGLQPALPLVVDPEAVRGVNVSYEIRIRGGPRFVHRFQEEALTVEPAPSRPKVDCHISAEPVTFLFVALRRMSLWGALARGKLTAWGRQPWLGLKYVRLFRPP